MLPLVCVLIVVILGCTGLAIDLARLYYTGVEVQAAADAAALSATGYQQRYPNFGGGAATLGTYLVNAGNRTAGAVPHVDDDDIRPIAYNPTTHAVTLASSWSTETRGVQVTASARAPYVFAGVLGLSAPTVRRTAAAWIANVNGATCVRPIALPYTRMFEHGMFRGDSVYTRQFLASGYDQTSGRWPTPNYTQDLITDLQSTFPNYNEPRGRTYVLLPPWESEQHWDSTTATAPHTNAGTWKPVDFTGGNSLSDFTTFLSTAPGTSPQTSACRNAVARVGESERSLTYTTSTRGQLLDAVFSGIVQLCNRAGNNTDALCRDARGTVGVRTRVMIADSLPVARGSSTYTLGTREVTAVRVMCYFNSTHDICPGMSIEDGHGNWQSWRLPGTDRGYPRGTIAILLDGPASIDLTADLVFGTKPGITQRLLLVK